MRITAAVRDGVLTTISAGAPCPGCGCDPEIACYFTRTMRRADSGELTRVRVGYQCTCGCVVVDGLVEGFSALTI